MSAGLELIFFKKKRTNKQIPTKKHFSVHLDQKIFHRLMRKKSFFTTREKYIHIEVLEIYKITERNIIIDRRTTNKSLVLVLCCLWHFTWRLCNFQMFFWTVTRKNYRIWFQLKDFLIHFREKHAISRIADSSMNWTVPIDHRLHKTNIKLPAAEIYGSLYSGKNSHEIILKVL